MTAIDYPKPMGGEVHWWPGVYDCISAIAAKRCGYDRVYLSAKSLSWSLYGTTDTGVLSADVYLRAISNLSISSDQKIMVDLAWRGLPGEQTNCFARRAQRAGAEVLLLMAEALGEDTAESIRRLTEEGLNVVIACPEAEGSRRPKLQEKMKERSLFYEIQDQERTAVDVKALQEQGITDIILHFTESGTKKALVDFAARTMKDQNTIYHDRHDYEGHLNGHDYHDVFDFGSKWLVMEQEFIEKAGMR